MKLKADIGQVDDQALPLVSCANSRPLMPIKAAIFLFRFDAARITNQTETSAMVGITLSPEQIRSAPPEIRQWLEHEIAASLGLGRGSEMVSGPQQLAVCTFREAEAIYASIRGMFPVVSVFFELGRESTGLGQEGVAVYRLIDMLRHAHLPAMRQLEACLQFIDQTFQEIRNDRGAALLAIDPRGYCIVATETQRNILALWTQLVAAQEVVQPGVAERSDAAIRQPLASFETSGKVPASSIHLDGAFPEVHDSADAALGNELAQR